MENKYKPVACHFYDELEAAAVKRVLNKIVYFDENEEKTVEDYLIDLKTIEKQEFMILKSGLQIRLDKIVDFNGLNPKDYETCDV